MAEPSVRSSKEDRTKAALWFAQRGFGVFSVWSTTAAGVCRCPAGSACTSPGKHPITKDGFKDATTDPDRIRTFLAAGSDPNYGLVCPDGVFALDVDGDDRQRLVELQQQYGELPKTLRTNTANGFHLFYYWPDGFPRPLHKLFGMVTRWGTGKMSGYVIGPRSMHSSGIEYTPGDTFDIAALPADWAAAATEPEDVITVKGPELPAVGHRHDWLRDKARYYRGFIDDPAVLRVAMLAENAKLDQPKTEEEVDRAIGDVFERFPLDPAPERAERIEAGLAGGLDFLPVEAQEPFPDAPEAAAYEGTLGRCVFELADGTDASFVGLLGSLIAFCGAMIPGQAYFHRMQTTSPFIALVGETGIGRKGTAMMRVSDALSAVFDPVNVARVMADGLASGEGLVSRLHYKQATFPNEPTALMIFEEEFASLLAARGREGSTLDPKMRAAFDGAILSNRRANDSVTVTPPYWLSALIGITPDELRERMEGGSMANGSANRWLYLPVIRREHLATNTAPRLSLDLEEHLQHAREKAWRDPRPYLVEDEAIAELYRYSDWLPTVATGLGTDLVRRLGVQAFRIALVHAVVDCTGHRTVTAEHLRRAIALTEYARRGIRWVFGSTIGDHYADLLYRTLKAEGRLSKTVITRHLIRDPLKQAKAVDKLLRLQLATLETEFHETGRPTQWLTYFQNRGFIPSFNSISTPSSEFMETVEVTPHLSSNGSGKNVEVSRKEVEISQDLKGPSGA